MSKKISHRIIMKCFSNYFIWCAIYSNRIKNKQDTASKAFRQSPCIWKLNLQAEKLLLAIISDSSEHQYFLLYLQLPLTRTTMLTAPKSSTFPLNMRHTKPGNRVNFFILRSWLLPQNIRNRSISIFSKHLLL
jgi:hypothetical protein